MRVMDEKIWKVNWSPQGDFGFYGIGHVESKFWEPREAWIKSHLSKVKPFSGWTGKAEAH